MPQDAPLRRKQKQRRTTKLAKWRAKQETKVTSVAKTAAAPAAKAAAKPAAAVAAKPAAKK